MEKRISNRQLYFIIFVMLSGFTVISFPKIMANSAGTGAWIPILIATIVFSLTTSIIISLNNMFKGDTLFEYSTKLVGKVTTYIFTFIYILYFFGLCSMIMRSNSELVKLRLLPETPIWVTILLLVFFSTYAASKGLSNVGRIIEFFGIIILTFYILMGLLMWFYGDTINILPLYDSKETGAYIKSLPLTIMPFLGFEMLTIMPFSTKNKKALRYGVGAIITTGAIYILTVYGTYQVLGVEDTGNYNNALLTAIRRVEIDMFQFLKRLDIVAFAIWNFSIFSTVTVGVYTLSEYTSKLFPKSKGKVVLIVLGILIYISALIPNNDYTAEMIFEYLTGYIGLVPTLVIPLILFIVAKVKKNVEKSI